MHIKYKDNILIPLKGSNFIIAHRIYASLHCLTQNLIFKKKDKIYITIVILIEAILIL